MRLPMSVSRRCDNLIAIVRICTYIEAQWEVTGKAAERGQHKIYLPFRIIFFCFVCYVSVTVRPLKGRRLVALTCTRKYAYYYSIVLTGLLQWMVRWMIILFSYVLCAFAKSCQSLSNEVYLLFDWFEHICWKYHTRYFLIFFGTTTSVEHFVKSA